MELFTPPFCFETADAVARPLMIRDATSLFEDLYSQPAVMRNLAAPLHTSIEQSKALIRCCEQSWHAHSMHVWGIENKVSRRLVGYVKLQAELPRVELGLMFIRKPTLQQRRSYFDFCLRILDWAITQPSVHYIYAYVDPGGPSAKLVEHFGFKFEARLPNWEARPNRELASIPIDLYGMARPFTHFLHFLHHTWFRKSEHAGTLLSRPLSNALLSTTNLAMQKSPY